MRLNFPAPRILTAICAAILLAGCQSWSPHAEKDEVSLSDSEIENSREQGCLCQIASAEQLQEQSEEYVLSSLGMDTASGTETHRLDLDQAISQVNAFRAQHGVGPVVFDHRLKEVSLAHSADLARQDRVSHTGSNGSTLASRLRQGGYDAVAATENISAGQRSFDEAFVAWQESPVHRRKLLAGTVRDIGIAYIYDPETEYRTFWTMIMAEPF